MLLPLLARIVLGIRAIAVTAAPIVVRTSASLAVKNSSYLAGAAVGSTFIWVASPILVLVTGGLKNSIDLDNHCGDQCEEICNWVNPCPAEYQAFLAGPLQECIDRVRACELVWSVEDGYDGIYSCASIITCPSFRCSSPYPPSIVNDPHNPDQCYYCACDRGWIQIVYGVLEDYKPPDPDKEENPDSDPSRLKNQVIAVKSCWVVVYSYDEDNKLTIKYNPGLNEDFLKSKALKPTDVDLDQTLDFTDVKDLTSDHYKDSKTFDRSFWSAQQIDMECRKWQPGDLIPTR